MRKVADITASNHNRDDGMMLNSQWHQRMARAKETAKQYAQKKQQNILSAPEQDPEFVSILKGGGGEGTGKKIQHTK